MKKLFDILEVYACLILLLCSRGWTAAAKSARAVWTGLERLALVLLYLFAEVSDTIKNLCTEESADMVVMA